MHNLRKDYRDMLEKVQVDEAMHQRIMQNIREEQLKEEPTEFFYIRKEEDRRKRISFMRKYLSPVLCAAMVFAVICTQLLPDPSAPIETLISSITGSSAVPKPFSGSLEEGTIPPAKPPQKNVYIPSQPSKDLKDFDAPDVDPDMPVDEQKPPQMTTVEEYESLGELEKAVGFPVQKSGYLPFSVESVSYLSYPGPMAEITYQGVTSNAIFRKAIGEENISGDYNSYDEQKIVQVGNISLELFGDNGQYVLALWKDGTYTYSFWLSEGESIETWEKIYTNLC